MNILVNQIAIVHIPAVALNAKLFLDNMVELVRKHEGRILRDLTAETIPDRAEVLEEVIRELSGLRVVNTTGELVLDGPVLRRAEVVLEVEDENTAFETVLAEMSLQVAVETVHCEVDALALDACGIVIGDLIKLTEEVARCELCESVRNRALFGVSAGRRGELLLELGTRRTQEPPMRAAGR